ncbi:MAG: hypothetical protein ABW036_09045 [Flavitalea sp.]
MKIKLVTSDPKLRAFNPREVDELINSTILKPLNADQKNTEKRVFNNWDMPSELRPFLRCKKHDPL